LIINFTRVYFPRDTYYLRHDRDQAHLAHESRFSSHVRSR